MVRRQHLAARWVGGATGRLEERESGEAGHWGECVTRTSEAVARTAGEGRSGGGGGEGSVRVEEQTSWRGRVGACGRAVPGGSGAFCWSTPTPRPRPWPRRT